MGWTHLDAEPHLAACLDNSRLGLRRPRLERVAPATHVRHVLCVEFAVDGGFSAVVVAVVFVGMVGAGRDVADVLELGGDGAVDDKVGEIV